MDQHRSIVDALLTLNQAGTGDIEAVLSVFSLDDRLRLKSRFDDLSQMIERLPLECQNCATPITGTSMGRPRQYCSDACRQSAYRTRSRSR